MGENIIERVARAVDPMAFRAWQGMYDHCIRQGDDEATARKYADMSERPRIDAAKAAARAAIAALREPSDAMIEAGNQSRPYKDDEGDDDLIRLNTEGTWQSMIDTALTEGNEG